MDTFTQHLPSALRTPGWRRSQFARHLLAGVLLFLAVALFVSERLGTSHHYVIVAADLSPGTIIKDKHLSQVTLPEDLPLSSTIATAEAAVGRVVAAPLKKGDPLQQHHLLGPELSEAFGAATMVPIKLADPAAAELAVPGAKVSVISAPHDAAATTIAEGAQVIFATARKSDSTDAGTVLLALDRTSAERVAAASLGTALTIVLTPTM